MKKKTSERFAKFALGTVAELFFLNIFYEKKYCICIHITTALEGFNKIQIRV